MQKSITELLSCDASCIGSLSEEELLRILLRYIVPRVNTLEVIPALLSHFSSVYSLLYAPSSAFTFLEEPLRIKLVESISVVREFCIRSALPQYKTVLTEKNYIDFASMMLLKIGHLETEVLLGILFDKKQQFLGIYSLALGSDTLVMFDIKNILTILKEHKANALILVHNHPSGVASPSNEDEETTKTLKEALQPCGMLLIDHLIVARNTVFSIVNSRCVL